MKNQIELLKSIAESAHKGQFRRDGITPYVEHPKAVAESLSNWNEYVIAAAWGHDISEHDAARRYTFAELDFLGVYPTVIEAIKALTHQKGESYEAYLEKVSKNEIAKIVKVADIQHNLSDDPSENQKKKYKKALAFLARV